MADAVLLVTRDDWMRTLLVPILTESRFDPRLAASQREALDALGGGPIAAIVIDAGLRGDEAIEIVQRVRRTAELETIPIVVVCHADDADTRVELLDGGADACVIKPFRSDEVGAALRALLRATERVRSKSVDDAWDAEPPIRASLEGNLADVALASVLSMLEMERRSGEVTVEGARQTATLVLAAGTAVRARLGDEDVPPLTVARRILRWKTGRFSFHARATTGDLGRESIAAILLEAARLEDEDGPVSSRSTDRPTFRPEPPTARRHPSSAPATSLTRKIEPPRPPPIVPRVGVPRPAPSLPVKVPRKG